MKISSLFLKGCNYLNITLGIWYFSIGIDKDPNLMFILFFGLIAIPFSLYVIIEDLLKFGVRGFYKTLI